ncbi:MAG: choice-of-anchor D domain-containing protein [Archangium sp.]
MPVLARSPLFLMAAAVVMVSGCRCGGGNVTGRYGDLVVVQVGATGREQLLKDATVTLAPAFMGTLAAGEVPVRNVGVEEVSIATVTRVEGSEALSLDDAIGVEVQPDADVVLPVRFNPPQDANANLSSVIHRAKFELKLIGARPGEDVITVELVGEAVARDCFVPALVDFGSVPLRQAVSTTFRLDNGGSIATTTTVGPLEGPDLSAFDLTAPGGTIDVPAMGNAVVRVRFSPLEERAYSATTKLRRSEQCPEGVLELRGRGDDAALSWSPQRLDFGRLPLGVTVKKQVVISNGSNVPLSVTPSGADANFTIVTAPNIVPARGTATFEIACTPTVLGPLTGQVQLDIATEPATPARIPLTCTGGGPRIRVDPNPLQFGGVPLGETTKRRIIVQNVGTAPPMPGDASLNLLLGGPGGAIPWFAIVPRNNNTPVTEFGVGLRSTYDPMVGLPAVPGSNFVEFEVSITPVGTVQDRAADLLVYSNDATTPVARIPLTAFPRAREDCVIEIDPGSFDFGRTARSVTLTRTVMVKNVSTNTSNVCLISGIEMAPGSNLAFQVSEPPMGSMLVNAGSQRPIVVTASVPDGANIGEFLRGAVRLHAAGDTTERSLPVGLLVSKCLVADPVDLDVGLVEVNCRSASRPITLYNVCGTAVTVSGVDALPSPFNLTSAPMLPTTVQPGGSLTVSVNAAPTSAGSYSGVMHVQTSEGTLDVALRGTSDTVGTQTDNFTQQVGRTDILLVVDNSCSMGDEQQELANNFASFISSASMSTADWHIGVVSTDTAEQGVLRRVPLEPVVLQPSTPNVAQVFANRVNLGTSGSGFEQPFECMRMAVSEPNKSGLNSSFLRADAFLAVVVVTDALEQSPSSVGSYLAALRAAKGGRRDRASVSVVGPFSPVSATCSTEGAVDDGRYQTAVTQTGGVRSDICTTNWANDLQAISRSVFGSQREFELTGVARGMSEITVTIDGMPVTTGWSYDAAQNRVVFTTPPPSGSVIVISYRTACF